MSITYMSITFCIEKDCEYGAELYNRNITNNVSKMWSVAGIYDEIYESNGKAPKEITENLIFGLKRMEGQPAIFRALNPSNGWGDYEGALEFLRSVIAACEKYPNARIYIRR